MIFVLFFSLSGAKVQFIVIVHNLTPKKLKKIVLQHRIFSLTANVERKEVKNVFLGMCVPNKTHTTALVKCQ